MKYKQYIYFDTKWYKYICDILRKICTYPQPGICTLAEFHSCQILFPSMKTKILDEVTQNPLYARSKYPTQLAKMSFRRTPRLGGLWPWQWPQHPPQPFGGTSDACSGKDALAVSSAFPLAERAPTSESPILGLLKQKVGHRVFFFFFFFISFTFQLNS